MVTSACPCCGCEDHEQLYPQFHGTCITSDMEILPDSSLENRLCKDCGLIFNAGGTRGATEEFYRNSYSLMTRNDAAQIQSFAGGAAPKTQAERTYDILSESGSLADAGTILEIGAGKGDFLSHFAKGYPKWTITAFEPSSSFSYLKENFPSASLAQCDYGAFDAEHGSADLVVALGVLEHVDNPYHMLSWANDMLKEGGTLYIRVPNFSRNPNDLFCADHLSKLTVPTLQNLMRACGFQIESVQEIGVPVFIIARKAGAGTHELGNVTEDNRTIAATNSDIALGLINSVLSARDAAKGDGSAFAIFGLGSAGLFAPFFGDFAADDIAAYVDENQSVHGSTIHGRSVGGLELIKQKGIGHIALAVSPVYFEQVKAKLEPLGVTVHAADA